MTKTPLRDGTDFHVPGPKADPELELVRADFKRGECGLDGWGGACIQLLPPTGRELPRLPFLPGAGTVIMAVTVT